MATEVKVPVLPESVSDATIASWHKKAGEAVKRDENLVDLETDKVVLEVPSPVDGVLKEIKFEAGSTVILYTDGLVEARHRDIDARMTQLAAAVLTVLVAAWLLWRRPGAFATRHTPLPDSAGEVRSP